MWSEEIARTVKATNAYIANLADAQIIVFDSFSILADSQGMMSPKYRTDELHLNKQGYVILNQAFMPIIKRIKLVPA